MSRRGLSLAAGISQARVGQMERNPEANPRAKTIAALADALDVDPTWLLTGEGRAPRARAAVEVAS